VGQDEDLGKLVVTIEQVLQSAFRDPDLEVRRTMRKFLRYGRNVVIAA
jgi:hypothetical protein